jgi:ubiquinone/menaquinone biosynthesis C-methylase UbiE
MSSTAGTTREVTMSIGSRFFALMYDRMSDKVEKAGLGTLREQLLSTASGRVLEIGGGTGANLRYYGASVESLTVTEPEPAMLKRLQRRAQAEGSRATILRAPAEDIPFGDDSFDTAVSTLVLCGVDDQQRALREIRRVLRPGGRFLFIEHVRSDDDDLAKLQDRMNGINRIVARCECNRATLRSIEAEGFEVTQLEQTMLPKAPKFVRPLIVGVAVPRAAA